MSEISHGESYAWGSTIKFEEYSVDSNEFNHLIEPDYDAGSEHGFWPMSEKQFNNLLPVRGFRDANGPTYRDHVVNYLKEPAPGGADEASWHMLCDRKKQLSELEATGNATVFQLGCAQRAVDVAREIYGWARGAAWARANSKPPPAVFEGYDYFEPWRIKSGLDYWILPDELEKALIEQIRHQHGGSDDHHITIDAPDDCPFEITLNAYDQSKPNEVIYSKKVSASCSVVATRDASFACQEVWLDDDEMLKRRKAAQQAERDERKRRRDGGENYFDLVMPSPNPTDEPGFWDLSIGAQMRKFPAEWSAADTYRAILVCSGAESKYQRMMREVHEARGLSTCPKCAEMAATIGEPEEDGKRRAECAACGYKFKVVPGQ